MERLRGLLPAWAARNRDEGASLSNNMAFGRPSMEECAPDIYVHEEEEQERINKASGFYETDEGNDEYVLVIQDKHNLSSAKSAAFNLVNNIIGGGVLVR